jgi:membrane-anchored protein YejM (alkaline phosphatase superfamily)
MEIFTSYVRFIFIVKFIFIILSITLLYTKHKTHQNKKLIESLQFWRERIEFFIKIMIAILLIYVFNPRSNNLRLIKRDVQILLYLFGFILILTEDWSTFVKESRLFKKFQTILSNR